MGGTMGGIIEDTPGEILEEVNGRIPNEVSSVPIKILTVVSFGIPLELSSNYEFFLRCIQEFLLVNSL